MSLTCLLVRYGPLTSVRVVATEIQLGGGVMRVGGCGVGWWGVLGLGLVHEDVLQQPHSNLDDASQADLSDLAAPLKDQLCQVSIKLSF